MMHYQTEADYLDELHIGDDIEDDGFMFEYLRNKNKEDLAKVTDKKLIDKILHYHHARDMINNIVGNGRFKAYDIAKGIKNRGYKMTDKQRQALINVFAHFMAG